MCTALIVWGHKVHLVFVLKMYNQNDIMAHYCDIHAGYISPSFKSTTHPIHSARPLRLVAARNKAVTQEGILKQSLKDLFKVAAKSSHLTREAGMHLSAPPAEVLQRETMALLSFRAEEECLHTLLHECGKAAFIPSKLLLIFKVDSWLGEAFVPAAAETHCRGLAAD